MDHSRQTGRPPLPTPRFRTVDGWERPASARATRSRFRSGSGTRTASAAAALRERPALADCAVRRSSRRVRRSGMEKKRNMHRVSRTRAPRCSRSLPLPYFSYAQGSVARSMAQPRYWVITSASMLAINAERRQGSNGSGNTAPTRLDGRVSDKCRIEFESSNRYNGC